jgi:predicted CoA-substrate-specific enzyme activase
MGFTVGIDIGSTTVKTVVLSESGELLFRAYERHFSRAREKAAQQLRGARGLLGGREAAVVITGSAGLGVSKASGIRFVQEVYATASAVRRYVPDADAAVELGGEDAKIIFFGDSLEERMNGSCAGGTGAFIDQMATLLNVGVGELDELALRCERVYPIASRCGVFAKSDIQPILNQGGRREDVAASIFQAVVDQTVAGLTQGRELTGKIVFLGGPLTYLKGLRMRFTETLKLDSEHAVFPDDADCFAALGAAALCERGDAAPFDDTLELLERSADCAALADTLEPLFNTREEYDAFRARHGAAAPPVCDAERYEGAGYLGIDAGSTTTKLVLISPDGGILYDHYGPNMGDPVSVVLECLREIRARFDGRVDIKACAATGYGEDLVKNAFGADLGIVETMAHYRAARYFEPDVDFIIDIGGQDVKCFKIRRGAIDGIMLNEACSSGCGSFVETFARALGYGTAEFTRLGLFAREPVDLGSRCTVFMNSSVKQAQKEGASIESISAGLSISVVKNAVYKVIRASSPEDMGVKLVAQGGTFLNDAVLRSFEREIGAFVTRPAIAGLMGAYGAALAAMDSGTERSALLDAEALANFEHTARPTTCGGCTNKCALIINTFGGARKYISGNRCSKPLGAEPSSGPNLMRYKLEKLRAMRGTGAGTGARGKVGIPFGMNMYEDLPFWFEFFTSLNFDVALSPESSRAMYVKGQRTIPSDTVCYPAKLMHGHVECLIDEGVDAVFYPCMPYNFDEGVSDNHYNCPVVAYYPELLQANIKRLRDVKFLAPYFGLHNRRGFERMAGEFFYESFGVPARETRLAAGRAYAAYGRYKRDILREGAEIMERAREQGKRIIVAAGRPYHIDPEINHGIDALITSLGLALVTEDAIPRLPRRGGARKRGVLNQWTYHARMYNAADAVCARADMQLVHLVSFGCGTDAIASDELREILEAGGKLYTQLKIDEVSNLGAARIRLRSLIAAMDDADAAAGDERYAAV